MILSHNSSKIKFLSISLVILLSFLFDGKNIDRFVILEHALPGEEHVKLPATIDRDEIDLLDGPPPPVCYFIVGGESADKFHLDPYSHELTVLNNANIVFT
jgi:hypothetical protein